MLRTMSAASSKQQDCEERELYNQARESTRLAKIEGTPKAILETGPLKKASLAFKGVLHGFCRALHFLSGSVGLGSPVIAAPACCCFHAVVQDCMYVRFKSGCGFQGLKCLGFWAYTAAK